MNSDAAGVCTVIGRFFTTLVGKSIRKLLGIIARTTETRVDMIINLL